MSRHLVIFTFAGLVAAIGFYLVAFSEPGDHRSGLAGVALMAASVFIAAYGLEDPQ